MWLCFNSTLNAFSSRLQTKFELFNKGSRKRKTESVRGQEMSMNTPVGSASQTDNVLLVEQGRLNSRNGERNTSQPERGRQCSVLKQPAGGGTASGKHASCDSQKVSEMGCSSGRLPSAQLATLDPECSRSHDGTTPMGAAKAPEDLSTLERLAQATGGTEKSWYRCVFPFGVISLVIGMAGSGVTFTFNTLPQTRVVSLVLLVVGFVLLLIAAACWRVHRSRRREKKEGGIFSSEQCTL